MIRVDYNGPRHINPKVIRSDVPKILHNYTGYEIKPRESHVHIYVEGEDLDWAIPLMVFSKLSEEERDGISVAQVEYYLAFGEMALAKFLFLIDRIKKYQTGFRFKDWHWGPYDPNIKKRITSKNGFSEGVKCLLLN